VRSNGDLFVVAVVRDVTERVEAERHLHESELALQQAERALAVAGDREQIARDLHDTVIKRVFAAGLSLQGAAARADDATRARVEAVTAELTGRSATCAPRSSRSRPSTGRSAGFEAGCSTW